MKFLSFSINAEFLPGKRLKVADTLLSIILLERKKNQQICQLTNEVEEQTNLIRSTWLVTDKRLLEIAAATQEDEM